MVGGTEMLEEELWLDIAVFPEALGAEEGAEFGGSDAPFFAALWLAPAGFSWEGNAYTCIP